MKNLFPPPPHANDKFISISFVQNILDINDLNLPKTCTTEFPDPDDLLSFKLIICPDEGFYKGGRFKFSFKVSIND